MCVMVLGVLVMIIFLFPLFFFLFHGLGMCSGQSKLNCVLLFYFCFSYSSRSCNESLIIFSTFFFIFSFKFNPLKLSLILFLY